MKKLLLLLALLISVSIIGQTLRTIETDIITSNVPGGDVDITATISINSGTAVNAILDEDDLITDTASALATQQSIKAYVDYAVSTMGGLGDVEITNSATNDMLSWTGSAWVNQATAQLTSLSLGGDIDAAVALDVISTTQGSRPCPTMNETQRDAITTPATGSCIFNSTSSTLNFYSGIEWGSVSGSGFRIQDIDTDTYVDTELNPDEDIIRLSAGGTETMTVTGTGVNISGDLVADYFIGDGSGITGQTYVSEVLGTRILFGATLSINATSSLLDISAGTGYVVDSYTDPLNPVTTPVSYSGTVGMTITDLASASATFLLLDSSGNISQQTTVPTAEQTRDLMFLGTAIHPSGVDITAVNNANGSVAFDLNAAFIDLAKAQGPINKAGNAFDANGANLKIDKSNGLVFQFGANRGNLKDQHNKTIPPCTQCTWAYTWRNASGDWVTGAEVSDIVPNLYDDGLGTATDPNGTVLNNQWTIQRVFMALSGSILIQYGQETYNSSDLAINAVNNPDWEQSTIAETLLPIASFIFRGGTSDLSIDGIFLSVKTFGGGVTTIEQNNWALVDIDDTTNPNNIVGCNVVYVVDASGGAVTVTLPDSSTANDGCQNTFILDANTNSATVTTSGGTQLIGDSTTQVLSQTGKGLTVISHGTDTKYIIRQDSRFLEGSTNDAIQVWNTASASWIERTNVTVSATEMAVTGGITATGTIEATSLIASDNLNFTGQTLTEIATGSSSNNYLVTKGYVDGVSGGGSGVGDVETIILIDGELPIIDVSAWDVTNLSTASFTLNATTPLNGLGDYLFTNVTGSASESVCTETVTVPLKSIGRELGVELPYNYDGDDNDFAVELYGITSGATETLLDRAFIESGTSKRLKAQGFSQSTHLYMKACYVLYAENNGKEFYSDDIVFTGNPSPIVELTDRQVYTLQQAGNAMTGITGIVEFNLGTATIESEGASLISAVNVSGDTRFTASRKTKISYSISSSIADGGYHMWIHRYNSSDVLQMTYIGTTTSINGYFAEANGQLHLEAGDYFVIDININNISGTTDLVTVSIKADATSEGVVHSGNVANQTYSIQQAQNAMTTIASGEYEFNLTTATITDNATDSIISVTNDSSVTKFTANKTCTIDITYVGSLAAAGNYRLFIYKNGTEYQQGQSIGSTATIGSIVSTHLDLNVGDYFSIAGDNALGNISAASQVTFTARLNARTLITPITQTAYLKNIFANGANGGSAATSAWTTSTYDTLEGDSSFVSVSANQITLSAGKYKFDCLEAHNSNASIRLYDVTNSAEKFPGGSSSFGAGYSFNNYIPLKGMIDITETTVFEVQYYSTNTNSSGDLGLASSTGNQDVYGIATITKLKDN